MERPRFRIGDLSHIQGALILSLVLVFWDMVICGSCLLSYLVIPVWFVYALIHAAPLWRTNPRVARVRVAMPIVMGVLVFGNDIIQGNIARAHAERIVQACKGYRDHNGSYPKKLSDLVPRYLSSVPPAKYCLGFGEFWYSPLSRERVGMVGEYAAVWQKALQLSKRHMEWCRLVPALGF